jgi:hypothetical protein
LVSRDYGNLNDETLVCDIRENEPFYAVLHNIKSASITLTGTTSIQSFLAKVSPVSSGSSSSPNQGIDPGSIPVGGIIAVSGTFANTAPPSGYSEAGILPLPSYLQLCDGSLVSDSESIFFGKFTPNISGDKAIIGSNTAGTDISNTTNTSFITGFGEDWNIFQAVDVSPTYSVKFYIRIK